MTTPEDDLAALRRALFDAAKEETPSSEAEESARAALARIPEKPSAPPGGTSLVPWIGLGVVLLGVGVGVVASTRSSDAPSREQSSTATEKPTVSNPAASASPPSAFVPVADGVPAAKVLPSVNLEDASVRPRPTASSARAASSALEADDSLARELALIDGARTSLRRSAPKEALVVLDAYAKQFPKGALRSEAMLVKVEALVSEGRRQEAEALARPFLDARKDELLARRLEKLLRP